MYNLERIAKFTENVFDMYEMDKLNFFCTYNESTDQLLNIPLFPAKDKDSVILCLHRVSEMIGIEMETLINMDDNAAKKYWYRYPFFSLYQQISNDDSRLSQKIRNNATAIKQRLIQYLRIIDQYTPGTFHEGAKIKDLSVETREFVSFPQFKVMAESLLDMYHRAESLFFKCVHGQLTEEEIREFNFLSHWMRLQDNFKPSNIVDYKYIVNNKSVYLEEHYPNLTDYAKSRRLIDLELWRFEEFSDDRDLAQRLLNILPGAKHNMNRFSMLALNYDCFFRWSDETAPIFNETDLRDLRDYEDDLGLEHTPVSELPRKPVMLYLPKTTEERADFQEASDRLKALCSPPSLGGLNSPPRVWDQYSDEQFCRLLRRTGR